MLYYIAWWFSTLIHYARPVIFVMPIFCVNTLYKISLHEVPLIYYHRVTVLKSSNCPKPIPKSLTYLHHWAKHEPGLCLLIIREQMRLDIFMVICTQRALVSSVRHFITYRQIKWMAKTKYFEREKKSYIHMTLSRVYIYKCFIFEIFKCYCE